MAKINAGQKPLVGLADADDLAGVAQNIALPHGLHADAHLGKARLLQRRQRLPEIEKGVLQGLLPLHAGKPAAVDHDPVALQPAAGPGRGEDVFHILFHPGRVCAGKIDEVRGVEGGDDAGLPGGAADGPGRILADMDAAAALIFIAVQPLRLQPGGGVNAAFILPGKAVAVAGGAKQGMGHG